MEIDWVVEIMLGGGGDLVMVVVDDGDWVMGIVMEVVMVVCWGGDGEEIVVEFEKVVVEIVDLSDGFKRRKMIEEVELKWKMEKWSWELGQRCGRPARATGAGSGGRR